MKKDEIKYFNQFLYKEKIFKRVYRVDVQNFFSKLKVFSH